LGKRRNEHQAFPRQRHASEMAWYSFIALRKRLPKGEGLQRYRIGSTNDRGVSARFENGGMRMKLGALRIVSTINEFKSIRIYVLSVPDSKHKFDQDPHNCIKFRQIFVP